MAAEETVTATGYLVIKGKRWREDRPVQSANITRARKSKPEALERDEILVKVSVQLPRRAFDPLEPEALIVVPEELIQHVVAVEAVET